MAGNSVALPISSGIGPYLHGFLQQHFHQIEDLSTLPSLTARLESECQDTEDEILDLKKRLFLAFSSLISQSTDVGSILSGIKSGHPCLSRDGNLSSYGKILHLELPMLAKEVGRIQSIRIYAETALHLEALVGNLEDATLSMTKHVPRKTFGNDLSRSSNQSVSEDDSGWWLENMHVAIRAMNDTEEVLASVSNKRPLWINLLKAVDSRIEKALGILRPQCLADHRILLASLGWPPSPSTTVEKDKCLEMTNPLSLMQGQKKDNYCQSFLALCSLQHVQAKREARLSLLKGNHITSSLSDVKDIGKVPFFKDGLWPIDELVKPIASHIEHLFSRWLDQPKFIFALVYKITLNFIDGVENILQPLIDKALLRSCSAKEAWVVAMVKMLVGYLEKQVFPAVAKRCCTKKANLELNASLLHIVDLMITFDKRMRTLASSGYHVDAAFTPIEGFTPNLSIMSIFYRHLDWLQMWAEMEVEEAEYKLTCQMNDESSWSVVLSKQAGYGNEKEESFIFSSREDYKAPLIVDLVVQLAWEMTERGSSLPYSQIRNQFLISSTNLFLNRFFCTLLQQIRDVEYISAVLDDVQLLRVCSSMNAARYCEHVLHGWSEDVNLMEMYDRHLQHSLFKDEAIFLVNLQTDCLEEIVTALLVHFDNLSWNYIQDNHRWEIDRADSYCSTPDEDYLCISPTFIEALDTLRDRIQFLKLNLNSPNFLDLWRSIAGGLDHFIFNSIPMSNARFSSFGVHQFRTDMKALFLIFRPFCVRPEAFFPCTSNCLKLLEIGKKDGDQMLKLLSQEHMRKEDCLRLQGIFHLSPDEAQKVLRSRVLS